MITSQIFDKIFISAGIRRFQISPFDLISLINGKFADLI